MQKDQLMRFIQSKYEECLRHLDKPEQQKLYLYWLIMGRYCNQNGVSVRVHYTAGKKNLLSTYNSFLLAKQKF